MILRLFFSLTFLSQIVLANTVFDFTQTRVQLAQPPKRVVTLAPSVSEIAGSFYTKANHPFVAVSELSEWPDYLASVQSVGPYDRFNVESVLAQKPDLVIATKDGNPPDRVKRLRELGLTVLVVGTANIKELERSILIIGKILGQGSESQKKLAQFQKEQKEFLLAHRLKGCSSKVMLQVGTKPLVVVGGPSYLSQALADLGCKNVYSTSETAYPRPSLEDAISKNPEFILILSMDDQFKMYETWISDWKRFPSLAAVKNGQIKVVRSDALLRPSLRWVDGLRALSEALK